MFKTLSSIKVKNLMIRDVVTVPQGTMLKAAAERMLKFGVGSLIITNGNMPVGIITERDFVNLVKTGAVSFNDILVDKVMTNNLITVNPETSFSKAFKLISKYNFKRLPVVHRGKLVGLLSIRQIMKYSRNALFNALERNRHLEKSAFIDELTGIYNKRFLMQRLHTEYQRALNYGIRSSVMFLDIDHFKKINDTFSHAAGDSVLSKLAAIIRKHIKPIDIPARYGGEEFVLILPFSNSTDAAYCAHKIREAVEAHHFSFGGCRFKVTLSAGVASLASANSFHQALERADQAMYHAKRMGRNRVCRWLSSTNKAIEVAFEHRS